MDETTAAAGEVPGFDPSRVRPIILGVLLAMFLGALDQTIVATALPTIGRDLHDVEDLSLVVTAYLVATAAAVPLYGKLSDIHGRRRMLMIAITLFVAGSVACALSRSITLLVVARGFQGLGGGGLFSLGQTIIADVIPAKIRGRYQAYFTAVFTTASIGGPVLGGFFAEHLHWSLVFWINVPLGAAAFFMCDRTLRRLPRYERQHRIDLLGAALMTVATICLLLALSRGGVSYAWDSTPILALLGGAAVGWALFALRLLVAREPFIPLGVLANRIVRDATIAMFFAYGTLIALTIYIPVYFETTLHLTASQSGLGLIGFMGGSVAGGLITGTLMARIAHYKRSPLVGLAVAITSVGGLAAGSGSLSFAAAEILMTLAGGGIGTLFSVATVSVQNAVPRHQLGTATGAYNLFRSLGATIMVAVFGAIFLAGTAAAPQGNVFSPAAAADIDFGQVFSHVFLAATIALVIAAAVFLLLEERPLHLGPPEQ